MGDGLSLKQALLDPGKIVIKDDTPPTVNNRGDTYDPDDLKRDAANFAGRAASQGKGVYTSDTVTDSAQALFNWLTAGSAPKPVEPGKIFADAQANAPVRERAGTGAGINGLFGFGNMIGEMQPIKPLKGIDTSPLQKGVPYSVPALPKMVG